MKRSQIRRGTSQLKRSGFKRKPYILKRRSPTLKPRKLPAPKIPRWVKAIPESQAHGSGTLQKRLWRLVSDFVRIRDWYRYDGRCVATGRYIAHWTLGDAGHFISWSKCNGMFKFDRSNIHLQSKSSNGWGDRDDWKAFEKELVRRVNPDIVEALERVNRSSDIKIPTSYLIVEMQEVLREMEFLPEQPDYYARVLTLQSEVET